MAEDLLQKLKEIDPAILTDVVRQDQNDPSFEITTWDVKRLSDKGIANPDGLWLFNGEGNGNDGKHSWAVVLKVFDIPEEELPLDHLWYWKREALFAQSDLAQNLPGPIRIPHYYRIDEQEDQLQLWMEHLQTHRPNPWTLDEYAFAAHQLGRWNGACLTRMSTAIEPWLAKQQYRVWSSNADPETNLQFHLNQKYILGDTRARYEHLCAEYEMFCNVLEALPQSFSHYDTQRRNLFIGRDNNNQEQLVLIDWSMCGPAALGSDLFHLVAMSIALMELPMSSLHDLETIAFENYLRGLRESGWSGNEETIRLCYVTLATIWVGYKMPRLFAFWCVPENNAFALQQFNHIDEELYLEWLPLFMHTLDCADEARILMKKLGYS